MENRDWIYINDLDNTVRYVLGVKGKRVLACFGINPSTAEPNNLDRTLESVNRIATNNGYDGWIMLNIYPQRSTDPDGIHDIKDDSIHKENLKEIKKILRKYKIKDVWVAWGTIINKREYLLDCLEDIKKVLSRRNINLISFGNKSKDGGHPHHPLYLRSDTNPEKFDVDSYLIALKNKKRKKSKNKS